MINGVPVVGTPAEIDVSNAEQLRMALLGAVDGRPAAVVADMTRTRFCDSAGLMALVRTHRQALAYGCELRLVVPAGGALARVCAITGTDQVVPLFGSLDEALARGPRPRIGEDAEDA